MLRSLMAMTSQRSSITATSLWVCVALLGLLSCVAGHTKHACMLQISA
jgi:hypothetical protein